MGKKNYFKEYENPVHQRNAPGITRTFSKNKGNGISVYLQYNINSTFREYETKPALESAFAEYEVVSSRTGNGRTYNKARSVNDYKDDLTSKSFFVESFDQVNPVSGSASEPTPVTVPAQSHAVPGDPGKHPASVYSPAASTNKQANKLLNAIHGIQSSASTNEINDGFLEDIKTILTDPKSLRKEAALVDMQSLSADRPAPISENLPAPPVREQDIFDKIARNMQYANQYDFGTLELEKRFDSFDREEDAKVNRQAPAVVSSAKTAQPATRERYPEISSSDFLEDIDLMARANSEPIPLDPGVGGRSILPSVLEPADIILSTTTDPISTAIRSGTGSEVSHASIYIGNGRVIHASDAGVVESTLADLMNACSLCVAYHHSDMTDAKAAKIVTFLKDALANNKGFDGWGLIHAAPSQLMASYCDSLTGSARQACLNTARDVRPGTDNRDQFFCSELIFEALKEAGLTISTIQPSFSSPQEAVRLYYDGTLQYVGHLKV